MDAKPLPSRPNLEQYKKQAKTLVKACKGDPDAIAATRSNWPELKDLDDAEVTKLIRQYHVRVSKRAEDAELTLADAQLILARAHAFESWPKFSHHLEALARANSPASIFEEAADAVVNGDTKTLKALLEQDPKLARARSERTHGATLLHYVSANGVEDYRQKTPPNAVEIAQILIEAGADVNAYSDSYGGKDTPLALTATSVHPANAGVMIPLLDTLLAAGATIGDKDVNACLANGRPQSARHLADRGAPLDLEGGCGLGRLDLVKSLFQSVDDPQVKAGFMWACEYGHTEVVAFLAEQGFDIGTLYGGMTGFHWAVIGGQLPIVELLVGLKAPLEIKNGYGGTVLDNALWAVVNSSPVCRWGAGEVAWAAILRALVAAGAKTDVYPGMQEELAEMLRRLEAKEV